MSAKRIDGKAIAKQVREEVALHAATFNSKHGRSPGLAAVLVGDDPASHVYVKSKHKACQEAGLASWIHSLPASTSQSQLLDLVHKLNADNAVDGILVQLPLPKHINEFEILCAVDPLKDVDGFGPVNAGLLSLEKPRHVACTPLGIWELLKREKVSIEGKHAVILGRSGTVGKPLALLLMQKHPQANATVTVCHSKSSQLKELALQADVLVAAIGRAEFVTADMVKPGAVVIDVGINRQPDGKLVGDVAFDEVAAKANAITPVPGGVGPMTIAMLLHNTLKAAELRM